MAEAPPTGKPPAKPGSSPPPSSTKGKPGGLSPLTWVLLIGGAIVVGLYLRKKLATTGAAPAASPVDPNASLTKALEDLAAALGHGQPPVTGTGYVPPAPEGGPSPAPLPGTPQHRGGFFAKYLVVLGSHKSKVPGFTTRAGHAQHAAARHVGRSGTARSPKAAKAQKAAHTAAQHHVSAHPAVARLHNGVHGGGAPERRPAPVGVSHTTQVAAARTAGRRYVRRRR
jgi:hypothetical protein